MTVWQADFYRRPLQDEVGQPLWELLICDPQLNFRYQAFCPQRDATAAWLAGQIQKAIAIAPTPPQRLQVFRPQSLSLLETASQKLSLAVEPTRHTPALKQWLQEQARLYPQQPHYNHQPYEPTQIEQPPPNPLPENLWGEQWRFAAIAAGDLERSFIHEPIPFLSLSPDRLPLQLGIASTTLIPGVVVYGGRRSWSLAEWIQDANPMTLHYIVGSPDGLVLEAGLCDRWILATFEDPDAIAAARTYTQRQQDSHGLHFLLVQPDESGMTYTGLWLLQRSDDKAI